MRYHNLIAPWHEATLKALPLFDARSRSTNDSRPARRRAQIEEEVAELTPTIAHVNKVMSRSQDEETLRNSFAEELVDVDSQLKLLQVRFGHSKS